MGDVIFLKDKPTELRPDQSLPKAQRPSTNRLLETLDDSKGGIPATGQSKNRHSFLIIDRNDYDLERITNQMSDMLTDLLENTIDTFTVDVNRWDW